MVFKEGRPIDKIIGMTSKPQLLLQISAYFEEFSSAESDNK
jgi:hypothetical protein